VVYGLPVTDPEAEKGSKRAKRRAERAAGEAPAPERDEGARRDDEGGGGEAGTAPEQIKDRNKRLRAEAAARRRAAREEERAEAAAEGLAASELVDDAVARTTAAAGKWLKQHFSVLQWVIVAAVAGGLGWTIHEWRARKITGKASDALFAGVEAERGRIGAPEDRGKPDPVTGMRDPTRLFRTPAERSAAAAKAYASAIDDRKGSGTSILARLGAAGVSYDLGKWDDAIAGYEAVAQTPLAAGDAWIRARALEGLGLAREGKGDRDGAMKAYKEMETLDVKGMKELALYHQARLHLDRGERDRAKELAKKLRERLDALPAEYKPAAYLDEMTTELMRSIDPKAVPDTPQMSLEQIKELQRLIQQSPEKLIELQRQMGLPSALPPGVPVPAPSPPASAP
jgi:tetratricopeptide (TPR) repeat protein